MCRFLCIATKGIIPHTAMSGFKRLARQGKYPPDEKRGPRSGWGVGYFPNGKVRLVREFGDAFTSVHYDEISHMSSSNPDARVLIGQLWSSPSKELLVHGEKIAPFLGKGAAGKEWLFAFDGTIGNHRATGEPFAADPVREMVSERVFRELLAELPGGAADRKTVAAVLGAYLRRTAETHEYRHMNLALTDGKTVFMARFVDGEADWNEVVFCKTGRAVIGCSEALPSIDQKWERLGNRQALVFDPALDTQKLEL